MNDVNNSQVAEILELQIAQAEREKRYDERWTAHAEEHRIHEKGHERDHVQSEKALLAATESAQVAIDKSEASIQKRIEKMDEKSSTFASAEKLDILEREFLRRLDEQARAITLIEKGDVKQEGRTLGQGAVIAIIVGAIGLMGTIISIIVFIANAIT